MASKKDILYNKDGSPIRRKTNGFAVASLVVSLAGLFIPYAPIIGIVLGYVAMSQIKRDPHIYDGKAMAKAGIVMGVIILCLKIIVVFIYILLAILLFSLPFFFIDW